MTLLDFWAGLSVVVLAACVGVTVYVFRNYRQ